MGKITRYVGLDVNAETIAVAVCEGRKVARSVGTPNRPEAVRKVLGKLGKPETLRVCYEAGPTGYVLYWQLTAVKDATRHRRSNRVRRTPRQAFDTIATLRRGYEAGRPGEECERN